MVGGARYPDDNEYDSGEPEVERITETEAIIDGKAPLDMLNELFETAPSDEKNVAALWVVAVYNSLKSYQKGLEWVDRSGAMAIADRLAN